MHANIFLARHWPISMIRSPCRQFLSKLTPNLIALLISAIALSLLRMTVSVLNTSLLYTKN